MLANVSIVTLEASALSTVIDLTAFTMLVEVFVTTTSEALISDVLPVIVAEIVFLLACLTSLRITSLTSISTVFVVLPALAVIVTLPALTPVTSPVVASTVAIASSLDENVTFVEAGLTVALTVSFAPTATSLAAFNVRDGFLTVIVAFNDLETFFPAFLAVTLTLYLCSFQSRKCIKIRLYWNGAM